MPKSKVSPTDPAQPAEDATANEATANEATAAETTANEVTAEEAAASPRTSSLLDALKTVQTSVWLLFLAALVLVGGLGYLVGSGTFGGNATVNLAGAPAGKGDIVAKPQEDGTFDGGLYGPRDGSPIMSQEDLVKIHRRDANDPFAIGAVDAPVTMTIFSDYECPYCAKFAVETQPALMKDYVDEGLLRIEWNDLAINGERAIRAAEAGRAAAAQGKFWEFNKVVFEASAAKTGHPEFSDEDLIKFAEQAGVADMEKFKEQLKSRKWENAVLEATGYGQSLGIQGTPQFLIGTTTISGALPEQEFRDRIELELMKVARAAAN